MIVDVVVVANTFTCVCSNLLTCATKRYLTSESERVKMTPKPKDYYWKAVIVVTLRKKDGIHFYFYFHSLINVLIAENVIFFN